MRRAALLAVLAAALTGCGGSDEATQTSAQAAPPAPLTDLENVLDLRAAFNADQGAPRLILLLSPT